PLVFPKYHRRQQAPFGGVERDGITLQCVGAVVEMYARTVKAQGRNRRIGLDASPGALLTIGLANREDSIAGHLRPKGSLLTQVAIAKLVQSNPVPTALFLHQRYEPVASLSISTP